MTLQELIEKMKNAINKPDTLGLWQTYDFTRDEVKMLIDSAEVMAKALEFYANKDNWEHIIGHTKWASNLRIEDCAFLNCGGGIARLAKNQVDKICWDKK